MDSDVRRPPACYILADSPSFQTEMSSYRCQVLFLAAIGISTSLAAYVFPVIHLQAKSSGGIKAFLPHSCGVQGFGFQIKGSNESSWKTGNGTKEGRFWTFYDKKAKASPGDEYDYAGRVWHEGKKYSFPITRWHVPDLVEDYTYPQVLDSLDSEDCSSEEIEDSREIKAEHRQLPSEPTVRQPTTIMPTPTEAATASPPKPSARAKVLQTPPVPEGRLESIKEASDVETGPPKGPTFSLACDFTDPPMPGTPREQMMSKQLTMLQCEMAAFLDRTTKLTTQLNQELVDLKKLNYETVARMQRLESLIRTIPRAVPYSYL